MVETINNNILIIDDTVELLEAYSRILTKSGYTIFRAPDGKSGMEVLRDNPISLVLLDVVLPDTNGFDLLKIIKSDPEHADIFIVLISAEFKSPEQLSEGLELGADGYLLKPITSIELAARINSFMRLKRIIDHLKYSETRFKKITEKIFDGILIIDEKGNIRFSNPASERMFSKENENLMGHPFGFPVLSGDNVEIEIIYDKEIKRIAELRTVPIVWEDDNMYLISLRDITERIQYEAQLKSAKEKAEENDKLKSIFLENVSHEIRTPMNAILGFSGLLEDEDLEKENASLFIKLIQNAGEQLLKIIDDVLDFSKIESNQLKVELQYIALNETIKEILEKHSVSKLKVSKENVALLFKPPSIDQEFYLKTDLQRFTQICDNLINNALKFTDKGSVEIGYSIFRKVETNLIQFYVRDTGIGMKQDQLDMIFERFMQAENNRLATGTGLGLSISKGLISLLGGQIWVESEVNKGTAFFFSLPFKDTNYQTLYITKDMDIKEMPDFSNRLIYIADDDVPSFLYLREILASTQAELVHAQTGRQLLDLMQKRSPDIVLLDIQMPEMDGFQVLSKLKELSLNIPIIVQTAYAMHDEKQRVLNVGASDYIAKPISQMELLSKMNKLLKQMDQVHN
jgi:signal transduction histidine kinase/DNA-binding response OmpR family regulator